MRFSSFLIESMKLQQLCFMKSGDTSPNQYETLFAHKQQELGLFKSLYEAKFTLGPQAYLYKQFEPLISQINGFIKSDIRIINGLAAKIIYHAGKALKVPISTTILAQTLTHFFYARRTYIQYDIRDIAMGAMYLACKSEQTLRKTYQIVFVFDHIFKILEGQKESSKMVIDGPEYNYMKNKKLIQSENDILFELGFEVYRLTDIPHRYLGALLGLFEKNPNFSDLSKKSLKLLNDCSFTNVCLYYPSQIIAAAAVYIAMKELNLEFPSVPWWILMEARRQDLEDIQIELKAFKECQQFMNLKYVNERMQEIGSLKKGIKNVFPLPYYRKVWLDRNMKLKIKIQKQSGQEVSGKVIVVDQQPIKQKQIQLEQIENMSLSDSPSSNSSVKKRKKKAKAKKSKQSKHKDRKKQGKQSKKKKKHKNKVKQDKLKHKRESSEKDEYLQKRVQQPVIKQQQLVKQTELIHIPQEKKIVDDEPVIKQQGLVKLTKQIHPPQAKQTPKQQKNEQIEQTKGKIQRKPVLDLKKSNLLSDINKQLNKHKQRIQIREEKQEKSLKSDRKSQKHQAKDESSEEDEQLELIKQLRKKVKLNKEQKQNQ